VSAYGFGDPCLPTRAKAAPSGPLWLHEIKHDAYRLMVGRTSQGVRIKTRRGFDWRDRFPLITETAERLYATSFVLDARARSCARMAWPTSTDSTRPVMMARSNFSASTCLS
jgi:bifunctional non-homologous end joining protein LigD